jgi:hypothetical protein
LARPQPVALICFFGGLPVREQIGANLGGVGRHLWLPSPGEHVIDGIGFDVGNIDHLIDWQSFKNDIVQHQEHLDRVGGRPVDAPDPTDCLLNGRLGYRLKISRPSFARPAGSRQKRCGRAPVRTTASARTTQGSAIVTGSLNRRPAGASDPSAFGRGLASG